MTLKSELESFVKTTHGSQWSRRDGRVVPDTSNLTAKNEAVDLQATVLYADLADSTGLVAGWDDWFAAEIYKNYLYCASRIIRSCGGEITAFDGDRVMGVFLGDSKNTDAAKCGLRINYAVIYILQPALKAQYPDSDFVIRQKVGVDTSPVMVAKTGVRDSNDLVWVGKSANYAAKLAASGTNYQTYITDDIYDNMNDSSKYGGNPKQNMWTNLGYQSNVGRRVYGSTWWWEV